jgi:quercetin dioxygenase-like cupin family protein
MIRRLSVRLNSNDSAGLVILARQNHGLVYRWIDDVDRESTGREWSTACSKAADSPAKLQCFYGRALNPSSTIMMRLAIVALLLGIASRPVFAAGQMDGAARPLDTIRFEPDDDVKCLSSALETGDPARGPSTFVLKAPPGCVVPWHFHTAQEQAIVIRGQVKMEMTGHAAVQLGPGGFAMMQGKVPHQFACYGKSACLMIVVFDGIYDIFWGQSK